MSEDRDWIYELERHDGLCIIKFVDDPKFYCRIVRNLKSFYGIGETLDDAIYSARKSELEHEVTG